MAYSGAVSARSLHRGRWLTLLGLTVLAAGCASTLSYKYRPNLTASGADILAALTIAGGNEAVDGNGATLLQNGASFDAMLADITAARTSIHLETFIFRDCEIGRTFVKALAERASAGVEVRLLLDAFGSLGFGAANEALLRAAGARVEFFNPLLIKNIGKVHLRTHRKVLIIDGRIAFTGGVCIDDDWVGNADRPERWRDTMVRVEGPVVRQMQAAFARAWVEATRELLTDHLLFPRIPVANGLTCQVMESVPGFKGNPAHLSFLVATAAARRDIIITNAYFAPDDVALDTLIKAARRGVRVRLLLPSRRTDHRAVRYAGRSDYGQMLKAGIEIWEYEACQLHAKTMVVDGRWSSVGSTNLTNRSFLYNYEANLNVFDDGFASQMEAVFEQDLRVSSRITLEAWKRRPFGEKLAELWWGLLRSQY